MAANTLWKLIPSDNECSDIAKEAGISALQATLLFNRGIKSIDEINKFLFPKLAELKDPRLMYGMDLAAARIADAVEFKEAIGIHGDYDVDGLTSTALLYRFLLSLYDREIIKDNSFQNLTNNTSGSKIFFYIPSRSSDGYGLSIKGIEKLHEQGAKLLITVDCGISNCTEIENAKKLGMDVIVTDHHIVKENEIPDCIIINPNQESCPFPFKGLAGVGVAFFLAVAVRSELRNRGFFCRYPEPDLREYLDFVALGTLADYMPVVKDNRALVVGGIKQISTSRWKGLKALMPEYIKDSKENTEIKVDDMVFRFAPRLNAPGRISNPDISMKLLISDDPIDVMTYAQEIEKTNRMRKEEEEKVLEDAKAMIDGSIDINNSSSLILGAKNWHKGVIGIVASRLVSMYQRPTLLYVEDDGMATGSGRAADGFNLYSAVFELENLFERFGGHEKAIGFMFKVDRLYEIKNGFERIVIERTGSKPQTINIDAELSIDSVTEKLVKEIERLAPFGTGNPKPLFLLRRLQCHKNYRIIGMNHLEFYVFSGFKKIKCIAYELASKKIMLDCREPVDIIATPEYDTWGREKQVILRVKDICLSGYSKVC